MCPGQPRTKFDDPGRVYFYSGRWSYNYDTRLFLYPDTLGVDRSREFGTVLPRDGLINEGPVTYLLLPPYAKEIDALREKYPGGKASWSRYWRHAAVQLYRLP